MNNSSNGAEVNQAMQGLPALPAQSTNPARGGSDRQGNQQHECEKSNRDVLSLENVGKDFMSIKKLIHAQVHREV